MRWPLAALTFVLCIAQFPLELAAPRLMLITLGALCIAWDENMLRLSVRAAAVVAAVILFEYFCVLPYRGNLVLREVAERTAIAGTSDAPTAAILARRNLDDLDHAARARRLHPAWYMFYAANCDVLGRLPAAADAYTGALRVDDRPELYVNRARIFLRLGRTEEAVADLVKAARFDPAVVEQLDGALRARVTAAAGLK